MPTTRRRTQSTSRWGPGIGGKQGQAGLAVARPGAGRGAGTHQTCKLAQRPATLQPARVCQRHLSNPGPPPQVRAYVFELERHLGEAHRQAARLVRHQAELGESVREFGASMASLGRYEESVRRAPAAGPGLGCGLGRSMHRKRWGAVKAAPAPVAGLVGVADVCAALPAGPGCRLIWPAGRAC